MKLCIALKSNTKPSVLCLKYHLVGRAVPILTTPYQLRLHLIIQSGLKLPEKGDKW